MSRGGRRPGAGRKPKALAALRLEGGFRPGRHASLLKAAPSRMAEATKSDQGTNSSLDSFRAPRLDASVLPVRRALSRGWVRLGSHSSRRPGRRPRVVND